jgi:hypothetical protein
MDMNLVRARIQCLMHEPGAELVGLVHYVRCFLSRQEMRTYVERLGPRTLLRSMRYGRGLVVLGATETWGEVTVRNTAEEIHRVH